jgi:chemotaxis receptor (MCP) glutamine deamidase CheD
LTHILLPNNALHFCKKKKKTMFYRNLKLRILVLQRYEEGASEGNCKGKKLLTCDQNH